MKKCPWCGAEYPDEVSSCPVDGNRLEAPAAPPQPPTTASWVFRKLSTMSLLAPMVAVGILVLEPGIISSIRSAYWRAFAGPFLFALVPSLLLAGIVMGIVAVVSMHWHGKEGILNKAVAGAGLSGLILFLLVLTPILTLIQYRRGHFAASWEQYERSRNSLKQLVDNAAGGDERFYQLGDAAKASFAEGRIVEARSEAAELLKLAALYPQNWNYGNAIQDGNLVLGQIALREGRLDEAKERLLDAGKTPGSPQLNSFGPNMSLARDLLEKGERETVLEYFELCRKFWKMDFGKLDQWREEVKAGRIPDFGPNLKY